MRAITFVALLSACLPQGAATSPGEDLSCEYDPHDWWENAFTSLLMADSDGHFDYDPYGDVLVGRAGGYDFSTGDFSWSTAYHAEHPYTAAETEGYGTIYDNGDLDLVAKTVFTDVLGATWADQIRTKREGCTGTLRRSELAVDAPADAQPEPWADSLTWEVTIAADDVVAYHMEMEEEFGLYVSDSTSTPDVASAGTVDYADGGYVTESLMYYDGTGETSWVQHGAAFGDDVDFLGVDTYYLNGSTLRDYDIYDAGTQNLQAEIELLYLYDGSATGTYSSSYQGSSYTCEVTITVGGGSCTMECDFGTYDC
ncbi:MAG: hypothetical protein ABIO70_20385 [Pseudomonadota bacterium]